MSSLCGDQVGDGGDPRYPRLCVGSLDSDLLTPGLQNSSGKFMVTNHLFETEDQINNYGKVMPNPNWVPGHKNGGRPPGSRNKRTQEILDRIQGRGDKVLAGTRSDIWCLIERSVFGVRSGQAAIIFSFVTGIASRKVCIGVFPKHQRP
jgi:hypothetical protein